MNLSEINLDFNAMGQWPLPVKAAAIAVVSIAVLGLGIYLDTFDQMKALESAKNKEQELKTSFETKQRKAVNLQDYKNQLAQIESELFEMIRQMPTKDELASLLTDISQTALASGLEIRLFKPNGSVQKDFYSELPISIEVVGKYQELGLFISGLAALPRIVTIHEVNIAPVVDNKGANNKNTAVKPGQMLMKAIVKTYNESSQAPVKPSTGNRKGK